MCSRLCGTLVKPVKEECLLHLILFEERFLKLHCITTRCIVTNSEMTMPRTTRSFSPHQFTTTTKDTKSLDADNGWRLTQALRARGCRKCMDEFLGHTG
jgi:hypothetical protein